MKWMSLWNKFMFYLSNMLPTFIAVAVIYDYPLTLSTLIEKLLFCASLIPIALSGLGFIFWVLYLKKAAVEKTGDVKKVKEASEVSTTVSNYIMAYAVSVISVSVVGGFKGIILLIVLVSVLGIYAFGFNALLFNPFLMLLGYRIYWVELEDGIGSSGYVILRISGGPLKKLKDNEFEMTEIDNYFYYLHYEN